MKSLLAAFFALTLAVSAREETLDIYWIDSEGGGSTLIVTPEGESVLVDTGGGDSSVLEHYWLPRDVAVEDRLPAGCRVVTWPDDAAFVEACRAAGVPPGGRGVYAYRRLHYDAART